MSIKISIENAAKILEEPKELLQINLQEGTLKVDGDVIGYAIKKRETQKNYAYLIDPIRFVKYVKELKKANQEIEQMLNEIKEMESEQNE